MISKDYSFLAKVVHGWRDVVLVLSGAQANLVSRTAMPAHFHQDKEGYWNVLLWEIFWTWYDFGNHVLKKYMQCNVSFLNFVPPPPIHLRLYSLLSLTVNQIVIITFLSLVLMTWHSFYKSAFYVGKTCRLVEIFYDHCIFRPQHCTINPELGKENINMRKQYF